MASDHKFQPRSRNTKVQRLVREAQCQLDNASLSLAEASQAAKDDRIAQRLAALSRLTELATEPFNKIIHSLEP